MSQEIELELIKYESDFTKRSKDLKKPYWFSFPNDLLLHPDFTDINGEELKWFIWCISVCSKVNNSKIRLNIAHAVKFLSLSEKNLFSMIKKLEGKQILNLVPTASRPRADREPTATQQDKTNNTLQTQQDKTLLDFESAYNLYPLKKGKSKGLKKLTSEIKTKEDLELLIKAISNYKLDLQKNKTDSKYIKHFSTFCGEWRDWIDYDVNQNPVNKTVFDHAREQLEKIERGEL